MESFANELAVKKVISKEDIILLRDYINKKYVNYTNSQKSDVLANAVYQVLDKSMPCINKECRQAIKKDLVKSTILNNKQDILLIDILNICISIQDKSRDYLDNLISWVNFHAENKISKLDLEKYNFELNTLHNDECINSLNQQHIKSTLEGAGYYELINNFSLIMKLKNIIDSRMIKYLSCAFMVFILTFLGQYLIHGQFTFTKQKGLNINSISYESQNKMSVAASDKSTTSALPNNFKYKAVNQVQLKKFLIGKNSLLAEEPYFSTIISISKEYNLNPLILFAITGQEQGFVDKQVPSSKKMANNPFNVYHSWKEYNTNIEDASRIACITIINLCKNRPQNEEPFKWINRSYAEDKNWSRAVNIIYNSLEQNNLKTAEL